MKAASIISIVYGTLGLIWATVITIVIRVSAAFFEHFPWPPEVYEVIDVPAMLDSVYGLIGNIFPYIFLIAILYIISGILHLAGKTSYKNIAYAAAILNIVWYVVYMVLVQVEIVPVLNTLELFHIINLGSGQPLPISQPFTQGQQALRWLSLPLLQS